MNDSIVKNILKTEAVAIERIHRLGKPKSNKCRPIILRLADHRDKITVLQNCYKLKGSNYSVGEDFSARIRNIRKNLWNYGKSRKEAGEKVTLSYDKLRINGELFSWDEEKNEAVPVSHDANAYAKQKNQQGELQKLRPRKKK